MPHQGVRRPVRIRLSGLQGVMSVEEEGRPQRVTGGAFVEAASTASRTSVARARAGGHRWATGSDLCSRQG